MKLHSSIFSSDTLNLNFRVPAGAIFALTIVVAINVWAYIGEKEGSLYSSIPRQMIDNSITELTSNKHIWWLGNSTLAAGLDKATLGNKKLDDSAIIELGSATLATTLRLTEIALQKSTSKPDSIILFFTKDDLNRFGARAKASKSYFQAMDNPDMYEYFSTLFPVYSTRYAIVKKIKDTIVTSSLGPRKAGAAEVHSNKPEKKKYKDLSVLTDSTYLLNLGRNFELETIDFTALGNMAEQYGTEIYLIAPPVTKAVAKWQKKYAPEYSWEKLIKAITDNASSAGLKVLDYSSLLDSSSEFFKDTYHLNHNGATRFTNLLANDLGLKGTRQSTF